MTPPCEQTILYADCFSGISGDMFLGALLNAGLPLETLRDALKTLAIDGLEIESREDRTNAIAATNLSVRCSKTPHCHRTLDDIHNLIQASKLSNNVQQRAMAIFTALAKAEASVHGTSVQEVHFHEVGAIDSIVDIIGAAIGLDHFGVDTCASSHLPMPSGWVQCDHGQLPLPAPAVSELTKNIPVYGVDHKTELVTPTGAAIIKTIATQFGTMPKMTPTHVGYGAGDKRLANGQPNLLRLVIGRSHEGAESQEVVITETNLDDWPPERVSYLQEKLFTNGALDVVTAPIQMKKNRPGFSIQIISSVANSWELQKILLNETSATGLRYRKEQRWTLLREHGTVPTQWGAVHAKAIHAPNGTRITPEYEDCRTIAHKYNVPIDTVYNEVMGQPIAAFTPNK